MEQDNITAIEPQESVEELQWSGHRLRQAREALNLTQVDVALQLHLNVKLIQALEDNNENELPARTYLIGYLRNYARLLNLSADTFIDTAQLESQPTANLLPENINLRPRSRRQNEPVLRPVLLGMLVVLILAAGWWILNSGPEWLPLR